MPDILPTATPGTVVQANADGAWVAVDASTLLPGGVDYMATASVPAVTIAADATTPVAIAPFAGTVASVTYVPSSAITGAASPASRLFSLYNRGQAGAGTTVVAILSMLGGVNAAENDMKDVPRSITPADIVVAAGDVLDWESLHIGATGLVDPGGIVRVTFNRA